MYFEDFTVGYTQSIAPARIDKKEMLAFARRYDNVPLHTDEDYAAKTPFGGLIAPGVMSFMAVWANYLEADLFGEELLAGKSTKIEWFKPVYTGDVLTAQAQVTALKRRNSRNGIVELTIQAWNQKNELVLSDVTEAIVKSRPTE